MWIAGKTAWQRFAPVRPEPSRTSTGACPVGSEVDRKQPRGGSHVMESLRPPWDPDGRRGTSGTREIETNLEVHVPERVRDPFGRAP
jgi:hypothetical protein